MLRKIMKASTTRVAVSSLMMALAAGVPQSAFSGSFGTAIMKSQRPCEYSLQLQTSVEQRRRYLVNLSRAASGTLASNSAVEEMYDNIELASASSELLGFETKQIMQKIGADSFSTECISCHDGVSSITIGVNLKNDPLHTGIRRSSGTDHPIGMDYQSYVGANPGKYKPVFGRGNMIFVDGKVGCLTCHDMLNPERKHLVMSDRQSALCLTCHDT